MSPSGAGILACLDGYMNIAMEATEVSHKQIHPFGSVRIFPGI
jgi:hypothetical protein